MNIIKKKFYRLLSSKRVLYLIKLYHKIFGERDIGSLNFDFSKEPSRSEIIQWVIDNNNFESYLEIGCFSNELFDRILCNKKIGVDPISGGNLRMTSDEFFKNCYQKFDCIFIDGLHEYSQVKRDIENSLNFLNSKGIILLHDCLPSNVFNQAMPRCQYDWNGDVWKAIVEFRTKKNLDIYTCYADQGIGVIFQRENKNILNLNLRDFKKLKFQKYYENYKEYMNVIKFDELKKLV
jgi:hypothetical protein